MNIPGVNQISFGVQVEHVSPQELYHVLAAASSQDPTQLRASSDRLKQMFSMFGTFDALHEIAAQKTFPLPIRQQAIIQFKNAALNHWRARKLLSEEQRESIRTRCLLFLEEEDEIIATCNEVIVAKISRQDFPKSWANLVTDLMTSVDSNLQQNFLTIDDPRRALILRRGFKLLYTVLKEFASMKMLNGVKIMSKIVEDLHIVLTRYYSRMAMSLSVDTITPQFISTPGAYNGILLAHLVYKSITAMAIWAWHRVDKVPKEEQERNYAWVQGLFRDSVIQVKVIAGLRSGLIMSLAHQNQSLDPQTLQSLNIFTRHLCVFGKFFRRLQQLSQSRFVAIPTCTDLILFYWSQIVEAANAPRELVSDSCEALYPVRYLVQGMVLFKETLSQWTPVRRDGTEREQSLSKEFVEDAVRFLITRFIPLNPRDLEKWMADPEEWVKLEESESVWEYELRPCSERVLMQLSNQYPQFLTPLLESTFKQVAVQPAADLPSILQKEALYCAVGRCAIRLKNLIPFDQWLERTLTIEARESNPNYPVIKRRIAWVIGKWVSEDCTTPNNPNIWEVLVYLLQERGSGTDIVVRLTAATALRDSVDTIAFDPKFFQPYLPTALSELINLMREVDTCDVKRHVGDTLNIVIERVQGMISPFIHIIIDSMPLFWTEAGDQWLLKSSLLITMTKLIQAIRADSTQLGGILIPLIRESLAPDAITKLDEDALNLWRTALQNTMTLMSVNNAPALFDLLPQAVDLLSTNFDLLGKITSIIESYFLLDGSVVLQACSLQLLSAFLTALKSESIMTLNATDLLKALSLLVQLAPSGLWGEALHTSGLFAHLLVTIVDGEAGTSLLIEYMCLLSRIVMADKQLFLQLVTAAAIAKNLREEYLISGILDQWYNKFDNMSEPRFRKLIAMGFASLVSTGREETLRRLPVEIFNLWIDVFCEMKEAKLVNENWDSDRPPSPSNLRRHWELNEAPASYYQGTEGTPEYDRRKAVYDRDPIRTMHLGSFVGACLREAEAACGPEAFQARYLSKVEPGVLEQIQAAVTSTGSELS